MHIKGTEIARALGLKTDSSFHRSEVYSVGLRVMGAPSDFMIRWSGDALDTHKQTLLRDERDMDAYDVWEGNDDSIRCRSCSSPEAIDRCVKVTKARVPGTNTWMEATDHIVPLCSECMATKYHSSGTYAGVTKPPPTGQWLLIQRVLGGSNGSASWDIEADDRARAEYWAGPDRLLDCYEAMVESCDFCGITDKQANIGWLAFGMGHFCCDSCMWRCIDHHKNGEGEATENDEPWPDGIEDYEEFLRVEAMYAVDASWVDPPYQDEEGD